LAINIFNYEVILLDYKIIKKSTFIVLTSVLFLVGCQTAEKEVKKDNPVEEVEKAEKEETVENKNEEVKIETVKEIDKEAQAEIVKNSINFAKDDIMSLDNRNTTFNYSEYDKSDKISFYNETMVEKLVEKNVVKEAMVTNTNLNADGVEDAFTVLFGDGKTYKKDATGSVITEPNDGFGTSEEFFIFTESLNQYIGFIHEILANSEYNAEDVILVEDEDVNVLTFDAKDKTTSKMYHFEIKVNKEHMLEKLTMTFDDNGKKVYTLDKEIINTIKHDFY
jgi:hypothetical protein